MKRKIERWKNDISAAVKDIGELASMFSLAVGWVLCMYFTFIERSEASRTTGVGFLIFGVLIYLATHITLKSFRAFIARTFLTDIEE